MLSVKHIASVKVAVELCNGSKLKKEILHAMDSNYRKIGDFTQHWFDIVDKKISGLLENLGLGSLLLKKVIGLVLLIGLRMLTWAKYHESVVGIPRSLSINFLKSSLFTSKGIINNKKAAEELLNCQKLNSRRRYKLACLYCFVNQIPDFFKQMSKTNQRRFVDAQVAEQVRLQPLIQFWSYFLKGKRNPLRREQNGDKYLLEIAIKSGSQVAVEYCLEKININGSAEVLIMDVALNIVKKRIKLVQKKWRYSYCIDILCCLLNKMTVPHQIEFLSKDFWDDDYEQYNVATIVLKCFLDWPHQEYFMRTAYLMWEFLPVEGFVDLLSQICKKIEFESEKGTLLYSEGNTFNYRKLLITFWQESPHRYKKYLFSKKEVVATDIFHFGGKEFILRLFSFKNFTNEDKKNIEMIFKSATVEEKKDIIFSMEAESMCIELMKEERWGSLNLLVSSCCSSTEQEKKFKQKFSFSEQAQCVCIDFVKNERYEAIGSFMRWCTLTNEEIFKLKKEMIQSNDGKQACSTLISKNVCLEAATVFSSWFISSTEELKEFKKELIRSHYGEQTCRDLILIFKFELVDEFIRWCISEEEEIRLYKRNFAYRRGSKICLEFISQSKYLAVKIFLDEDICQNIHSQLRSSHNEYNKIVSKAKPLQNHVERFLTFCFSSKIEINKFKEIFYLTAVL